MKNKIINILIKIVKVAGTWIISFLIALLIFWGLNQFFSLGKVSGESMTPTYLNGEKILIQKKFYDLEQNNVIVFWADKSQDEQSKEVSFLKKLWLGRSDIDNKELHIKRLVGIPGDKISVKNEINYNAKEVISKVYVNEELIAQSSEEIIAETELILKEDEYYVIGDNYDNSLDSRIHGPVKKEDLVGKVMFAKENANKILE